MTDWLEELLRQEEPAGRTLPEQWERLAEDGLPRRRADRKDGPAEQSREADPSEGRTEGMAPRDGAEPAESPSEGRAQPEAAGARGPAELVWRLRPQAVRRGEAGEALEPGQGPADQRRGTGPQETGPEAGDGAAGKGRSRSHPAEALERAMGLAAGPALPACLGRGAAGAGGTERGSGSPGQEAARRVRKGTEAGAALLLERLLRQERAAAWPGRGAAAAQETSPAGQGTGLLELDRAAERDARRYDSGFGLY